MKYLLVLLFGFCALNARIGCMDNSYHGDPTKYDTKTYHYVRCDCPCEREYKQYIDHGYFCMKCGHAHEARPIIIVPSNYVHSRNRQNCGNRHCWDSCSSNPFGKLLKKGRSS